MAEVLVAPAEHHRQQQLALTFNTAKEAAVLPWAKAQLTQAVDCLVDLQVLTAQRGIAPKCRRITFIGNGQ
ncbi:hypothetical protein NKH49_18465 [Mesorhizobium sp. M1088]|uniref:hypothetical protein n=1 Tax=unclassified Mesorhizobium TaxID=325217 RepID=UPI0033373DA6